MQWNALLDPETRRKNKNLNRIVNVAYDAEKYKSLVKNLKGESKTLAVAKWAWYGENGTFDVQNLKGYYEHYDWCKNYK